MGWGKSWCKLRGLADFLLTEDCGFVAISICYKKGHGLDLANSQLIDIRAPKLAFIFSDEIKTCGFAFLI